MITELVAGESYFQQQNCNQLFHKPLKSGVPAVIRTRGLSLRRRKRNRFALPRII